MCTKNVKKEMVGYVNFKKNKFEQGFSKAKLHR